MFFGNPILHCLISLPSTRWMIDRDTFKNFCVWMLKLGMLSRLFLISTFVWFFFYKPSFDLPLLGRNFQTLFVSKIGGFQTTNPATCQHLRFKSRNHHSFQIVSCLNMCTFHSHKCFTNMNFLTLFLISTSVLFWFSRMTLFNTFALSADIHK